MRFRIITILLTVLITLYSCDRKATTDSSELKVENRIFDNADLLTKEQEDNIFQIIRDLDQKIGSQIAVLTIDTLNGETIDDFSLRTAQQIGLGRKKFNDGLLMTIAIKDHAMRIEVGYGLERIIKDEIAVRIIREDIALKFRENDYFSGIKIGIEKIKKLIEDNKELVGQKL